MSSIGVPDLLTSGQTARTVARTSEDLARVAAEVSSGLKSDVIAASGGDPTRLYVIERDLALAEARRQVIDLAAGRSETTQAALERVQGAAGSIGADLLAAVSINDAGSAEAIARGARDAFSDAVAALNSRFGDRALFAGAAAAGPALADADLILQEIKTAAAGAATAADVIAAVDDWFADPAGFAAAGYQGAVVDASDVELDEGLRASFAVRADAPVIRAVLSALALGVIGAEGGFTGDSQEERLDVLGAAAERAVAAVDDVIETRSEVGFAEERIEEASVRIEAETTMLEQARAAIVARNPFEAATELTALETQLEILFSITARLSGLTLASFLR